MARRGKGRGRRGRYKRDRRGRFAATAGLAGAGFTRSRRGDLRGQTHTRASTVGGRGGRAYVTVGRGGQTRQAAVVHQIKGRQVSATAPGNNRITRSAVSRRNGARPGTPIRGSGGNQRYVSRLHAVSRAASLPASRKRAVGRAHSRTVLRIADRQGQLPRSGYIVTYVR